MNFEGISPLFLVALPIVWMTVHSTHGCFNSLLGNAFRVALALSAFSLPALATEAAAKTPYVLADAVNGLSPNDLKKHVLSAIPGVC
jgi:hypothetical protein